MRKTLFALLAQLRASFLPHIEKNHLGAQQRTNCTNVQVDCFCKKIKRRQPGARRRAVRGVADEEQENVQSKVFLLQCHCNCLTSMTWLKGIWGNMDVSVQSPGLQDTRCFCFAREKVKTCVVIALNFQALVALLLSALEIRSHHCLQVSRSSRLFWISPTTSLSDY